ncbi:MAG TPA: S26 family signal peptidase [Alphaproteobacteria bacterium]|nr:S26 family signal peptidase [Alphaproteobacteria bacterium]
MNTYIDWTCKASRAFWENAIVGIVGLGMILSVVLTQTHLYINYTPSLPYRAFICIKALTPQSGDFVSIQNHPTHFFNGLHYIKRLSGFPGDHVHIHHNHVYVEKTRTRLLTDTYHIGPLRQTTREGNALHPLKNTVIPEGSFFVSADHPHSFDSRYEEFGLVRKECITAKCFGLFKSNVNAQEGNP